MTVEPGAAPAGGAPEIVLDLSRLASRVRHRTPTGVDRCEMAYARELLACVPERLSFGILHPSRAYGRLPREVAIAFLDATQAAWDGRAPAPAEGGWPGIARALWQVRPRPVPSARGRARVFLQASPHHLQHRASTASILAREGRARFVCLIHDLIPLDFPEYARPDGAALHRRRIETVAALADGVIANSEATATSFRPWLAAAGRDVPVRAAPLGIDVAPVTMPAADRQPYFLCLGTIEPRKNHLLLLHVWRRLAAEMGAATPRLIVVGRRGWENEQVVDLLERCPGIRPHVEERAGLPDREVRALVAGAAALLLPSFAEGYGLPVPEALAAGTPVIASDLPALREAGGDAPDYLDPLDGSGWAAAIRDYAAPASVRRAAQLARLQGWRAPGWGRHIETVLDVIGALR